MKMLESILGSFGANVESFTDDQIPLTQLWEGHIGTPNYDYCA